MTYSLETEQNSKGGLVESWIPYVPMQFEKDDMPFRQEQLQIRTRECSQTLDLLLKLNDGVDIKHVLQSTVDLGMFKVFLTNNKLMTDIFMFQLLTGCDGLEYSCDCRAFVRLCYAVTHISR
jgi:hypothetical protein